MQRKTTPHEDDIICTLSKARQLILEHLRRLPSEDVEIRDALGRRTLADIPAPQPVPGYAESIRDGYVIPSVDDGGGTWQFRIVDEIAAGRVEPVVRLVPGTACRIMTGGMVPEGSERVVPFEQCVEQDGLVTIPEHLLQVPATFIRPAGSEIARGERLVGGGVRLQGEHLELLSSCGINEIGVAANPAVGYFCTGSELKISAEGLKGGQKVSSNSLLLAGILASYGATLNDFGIAGDTFAELSSVFAEMREWQGDVVVSTGGMGPGKYDLVEEAFWASGGLVFFNGLAMRPGKRMLFGQLGETLFFALPGPPHAVRTLLHTLVGPALLFMQGVEEEGPKKTRASLLHPLIIKKPDVLQLKDGVLQIAGGLCRVRLAGRLETPNCHILLPPGQSRYEAEDQVEVHVVGMPLISL